MVNEESEASKEKEQICSSYYHHLKKVLFAVGAYFAIAVEI